ncbi:MAG: glycosyltransferase family 9 protein [Melioribacteraceae bacterium]
MLIKNIFSGLLIFFLKLFLEVKENTSRDLGNPKNILIVRQHNQFGDLLASVSLFRAIKETFPESKITIILSRQNYRGVYQNEFIDEYFLFDKTKLFNFAYFTELRTILKKKYDVCITPSTVSISSTSLLLMRFLNSKIRIGPNSLDGKVNKYKFLFDRRINLDWNQSPDSHVADFELDIVRPFNISTSEFTSSIPINDSDIKTAKAFLQSINYSKDKKLIGLHVGAGKNENKWSLENYYKLIGRLNSKYPATFYLTGTDADKEEINFVKNNLDFPINKFDDNSVNELASLISLSNLFITNDTGVMHVAGTTSTPQISIFGFTNPFRWSPLGKDKFFIRKSDFINDVTVDDVYEMCKEILI